jgi:hypothetical protein
VRSYPRNSAEAAARIVAWTMLADGHAGDRETAACSSVATALGLTADAWSAVVRELCEDLLATGASSWDHAVRLDPATIDSPLHEVDDALLRRQVLALCAAVVDADGHLADGERVALDLASGAWSVPREDRVWTTPADGTPAGRPPAR